VVYADVIHGDDGADEIIIYCSGSGMYCIDYVLGSNAEDQWGNTGTTLMQSAPNSLKTKTTINFSLGQSGDVDLQIFDVNGRLVRNLIDGNLPAGSHRISWDGWDDYETPLTSGTYYYRLRINGVEVGTEKAVILR